MAAAGPAPPTPPSSPPPPPPSSPPPPPPSPLALRTTAGILRRSFSLLSLPLLAVVLLLLALRLFLLAGTVHLSSLPDRDPALRSLLLRLSLPPTPHPRPRRPHLFHLSRASDFRSDVFFSDDDPLPRRNSSFPLLLLRASKFPPNLARLPPASPALGVAFPEGSGIDAPHRDTPQITPRDAVTIVYTLALLSSTHSLAILAFILVYTVALGVVFLSVSRSLVGMTVPFSVVYSGAELGVRRLTEALFLRWAVRDAIVQLLCICFFSDVSDQLKLFRMFVGVKLLPFSLETEELFGGFGFGFAWETADMVTATLLAVNPFVVIMDYGVRRPGPDGVKEGVYLTMLMMRQAVWIKLLENVVCGRMGRVVLTVVGGRMFAMAVQAFAEVYFMVAWLVFYFAARCKDGELEGRGFGQGDLQECINGIR